MSARDPGIDLTDATLGGVYFIADNDSATSMFDALAGAASEHGFAVARVDLADCHSKADLLTRMAQTLSLPVDFGHNWDALSDCLRDLSWLESNGYVLLIDHSTELRQARPKDFNTLLDIFDDTAAFWLDAGTSFFVFLQLADGTD